MIESATALAKLYEYENLEEREEISEAIVETAIKQINFFFLLKNFYKLDLEEIIEYLEKQKKILIKDLKKIKKGDKETIDEYVC